MWLRYQELRRQQWPQAPIEFTRPLGALAGVGLGLAFVAHSSIRLFQDEIAVSWSYVADWSLTILAGLLGAVAAIEGYRIGWNLAARERRVRFLGIEAWAVVIFGAALVLLMTLPQILRSDLFLPSWAEIALRLAIGLCGSLVVGLGYGRRRARGLMRRPRRQDILVHGA